MSELRVNTINSNNTIAANTLVVRYENIYTTANAVTVNSTGLSLYSNLVISTSMISMGNSTANAQFDSSISVPAVDINGANLVPDLPSWTTTGIASVTSIGGDTPPGGGTTAYYVKEDSSAGALHLIYYDTSGVITNKEGESYTISMYYKQASGNNRSIIGFGRQAQNFAFFNTDTLEIAWPGPGGDVSGAAIVPVGDGWFHCTATFTITAAGAAATPLWFAGANFSYGVVYDGTGSAGGYMSTPKITKNVNNIKTEVVNTQIFTANGTWVRPAWLTSNSLVIVHMWGGGGGAYANTISTNKVGAGGGGGAFVFGYYKGSILTGNVTVTVGSGGASSRIANASAGGNSIFSATGAILTAYGGGGGGANATHVIAGGGGGWISAGGTGTSGAPLGGVITVNTLGNDSTFGGGGTIATPGATAPANSGSSVYGGGAGATETVGGGTGYAGDSIFGGGGGGGRSNTLYFGTSVYGGRGGSGYSVLFVPTDVAQPPGGGGGTDALNTIGWDGARGEVRVYSLREVNIY